jgi:predicted transcriptional regulator
MDNKVIAYCQQGNEMAKGPPIGVRVPADVRAALEKLAKQEDRSISYLMGKIVADYLRSKKLLK